MKIFIGADHRGFKLKKDIVRALKDSGHDVEDVGTFSEEPCDYPAISFAVSRRVADVESARGILICMSGVGHSIAANKLPGIYAALCYSEESARLSRQHNNANVLVLGAKFVPEEKMFDIITAWLATAFDGGRHERRLNQIKEWENRVFKGVDHGDRSA